MAQNKIKLKPCRCGRGDISVMLTNLGIGWACLVGCMSIVCDECVIRYGFTKKHATRRAIKAWNRRAGK